MSALVDGPQLIVWRTPAYFYDFLNGIHNFTIDLAADAENAKHGRFYDQEADSLSQDWRNENGFLNPPYPLSGPGVWLKKCLDTVLDESAESSFTVLVKAATETNWFCDFAMRAATIDLVKGRIPFCPPEDYKAPINKKTQQRQMATNNHGSTVLVYDSRCREIKAPEFGILDIKHVPLKKQVSEAQWLKWHEL